MNWSNTILKCFCASFLLTHYLASLKSCLDQTEDKNTKIKQLLVKTKKELADAKKSVSNRCTKLCGNQFRVCYFKSVVTFKMNLIPEATVLILFIGSKPARYSVIVERGTGGKPAATGRLQGTILKRSLVYLRYSP